MNKFELIDNDKIRHNLSPKFIISVIELTSPNDYAGSSLNYNDLFDEVFIKGRHFVFKMEDGEFVDEDDNISLYRSICKRAGKWYKARVIAGFVKLNEKQEQETIMEDDEFKLQQSDKKNHWIVAHKASGFIIEFREGYFNETQQVVNLNNDTSDNIMIVSRVLRETAEWLVKNHNKLIWKH